VHAHGFKYASEDCKACKTGRHMAHTCEKGGSRKPCKRKASVAHEVEPRDKSDMEQKLQEKLQQKLEQKENERRCMVQCQKLAIQLNTQAEFDSIIAGMDKELPEFKKMKICELPSFKTLIVRLSTPMAEK